MKQNLQIANEYLTYLILHKGKLDNKEPPVDLPKMIGIAFSLTIRAHLPKGRKYSYGDAWLNMNMVQRNGLPFNVRGEPAIDYR